LFVVGLDRLDSADARAHDDADTRRVGFRDLDAGILDRLLRCRDAVMDEGIALACFLRLHVLRDIEVDDRAGEASRERRDVKRLDRADAALAVAHVAPAFVDRIADGRDEPEPRDYDSPLRHALVLDSVEGRDQRRRRLMIRSSSPGCNRWLAEPS